LLKHQHPSVLWSLKLLTHPWRWLRQWHQHAGALLLHELRGKQVQQQQKQVSAVPLLCRAASTWNTPCQQGLLLVIDNEAETAICMGWLLP
jgi:hypothetical protein